MVMKINTNGMTEKDRAIFALETALNTCKSDDWTVIKSKSTLERDMILNGMTMEAQPTLKGQTMTIEIEWRVK